MAAVTSTSLGTDPASTRPAASGHTENTGMSFVESWVENTGASVEMPLNAGTQPKSGNAVESNIPTPGKPLSTAGSAMGVTQKVKDTTGDVKSLESLRTGATVVPVANKTGSGGAGAVLQQGAKVSAADAASQIKIYDDQPVPVVPGTKISQGQKLANRVADGSVQDSTAGAEDLDPQIATPTTTPTMDGSVKQVITGKSENPLQGRSQDDSAERVTKRQGTSVKTEKGAKSESKQDKKNKLVDSAVAIEVQPSASVQAFVNSVGAQPSVAGDAGVYVSSSASAVTSGRSAGIVVAANANNSKAAASTGKSDGNTVKTVGAFVENPSSQKTEPEGTKPETVIATNPDADKSKPQTTVVSAADSGQLRAISVASSSAPAVVPGSGLTHSAGQGLHPTEAISHAVATAQIGTNVIDTTATADAAHKTLTATPTSLEVGVSTGTHGWLKIRAEMVDGGSVNTSLSTSSPAGQEMLHREIPSLAAFLKSEHVAVNAVVVQPMPASGPDTRGSFAGASGSAHGQAQQSGSQGRENRQNPTPAHAGTNLAYSSLGAVGEDEIFSSSSYVQGGGWLSVRA